MCRLKQSCHGFSLATPLLSGGRSFPDDLSSSSAHTFSQSEQSQHSDDLNVGAPNSRVAGDVDSSSDDSITFGVFVDTSSRSNISSASLSDNENDESTDVPASKAAPAVVLAQVTEMKTMVVPSVVHSDDDGGRDVPDSSVHSDHDFGNDSSAYSTDDEGHVYYSFVDDYGENRPEDEQDFLP
ncbi:hypothetical protein MRX96_006334 [Rhipicephalus microplus]